MKFFKLVGYRVSQNQQTCQRNGNLNSSFCIRNMPYTFGRYRKRLENKYENLGQKYTSGKEGLC